MQASLFSSAHNFHIRSQDGWFSFCHMFVLKEGREREGKLNSGNKARRLPYYLCSHHIGWNLVAWQHLAAEGTGKCSLYSECSCVLWYGQEEELVGGCLCVCLPPLSSLSEFPLRAANIRPSWGNPGGAPFLNSWLRGSTVLGLHCALGCVCPFIPVVWGYEAPDNLTPQKWD